MRELAKAYPQYVENPSEDLPWLNEEQRFALISHEDLKVEDADIQKFSRAIIDFWKKVPENIHQSQADNLPDWFGTAFKNDLAAAQS